MPKGPSPAANVLTTRWVRISITDNVRLSGLEMNTLACDDATATPAGARPTGIVATTDSVDRSITDTSWLPWLVM